MLQNSERSYGLVARGFHWVIALGILCLLSVGFWMDSIPYSPFKGTVYGLHKSFGMTVLILAVLRILWKSLTPQPGHLPTHAPWEITLARIVHTLLYAGMIVMPLSGWVMSSAGQHAVPFFWLFNVPPIAPPNEAIADFALEVHELAAYALILGVGLHYMGAVKHHMIDQDETLRRMGGNILIAGIGAVLIASPIAVIVKTYLNGAAAEIQETSPPEAQNAPAAAEPAAPVTSAPLWAIDTAASKIGFEFTQYGQAVSGSFGAFEGTIRFDAANLPESLADIRIESASLTTGESGRDEQAKGADWFDAAQFPEIRFVSRTFTHETDNRYSAAGSLTIRGVTKDITLPFTLDIKDNKALMTAELTLNRLDYGVGQGEWASVDTIGNDVKIAISVSAARE
jgi:cytochrome b561